MVLSPQRQLGRDPNTFRHRDVRDRRQLLECPSRQNLRNAAPLAARAHAAEHYLRKEGSSRMGDPQRATPVVIGLAGSKGSGKTTIAEALAQQLNATVVSF